MPVSRPDRSLGRGQQWTNVTAQRVLGTQYTNNTGRAIAVSITTVANLDGGASTLYVDGQDLSFYQSGPQVATDATHQAIIPAGSVYKLETAPAGAVSIGSWFELR